MMKRFSILSLLLLAVLLPVGCHTQIDSDIRVLERRIDKLEQRCNDMNTTLSGIKTMLDNLNKYEFITDIKAFYSNGVVAGYTISFTHSDPIVLYNGTDAETPILGVKKGEDGVWYWSVRYPSQSEATFVTDNFGIRIPTDAGSPLIKIENGHWMVSYDKGEIWHDLGRATGEDGASFFSSVVDKGDYILFNLLNGTTIEAPTWASFEKLQEKCRKTNENVENFTKLVKELTEKVYVQDMVPIQSSGDIIGFTLRLSNGKSYSFYDGQGTNVPVIGARSVTGSDALYWTIRYGNDPIQWILDENGDKIQANAPEGQTPIISLRQVAGDPAWYWAVAYGDGEPVFLLHDGQKVAASVVVPETVVQRVVHVSDDMVRITVAEGLSALIPLQKAIQVSFSAPVSGDTLKIGSGQTLSFHCVVQNADAQTELLPLVDDFFYASASTTNHADWTVSVTAPTPFKSPSSSRLTLLVSNGYGQMKTLFINLIPME
jgi:regulator of extracellular matrix RemA (YlzA/DUF370 family)